MSEYFNSVKQFATSTFNNVTTAVNQQMATPQQPAFITVNRNQYQILEKQGEVCAMRLVLFFSPRERRAASPLCTRCRTRAARSLL